MKSTASRGGDDERFFRFMVGEQRPPIGGIKAEHSALMRGGFIDHQLELNRIGERLVAGIDHVGRDTNGSPFGMTIGRLNEYSDGGAGSLIGGEDTDLEVGESHAGKAWVERQQGFPQGIIHGIDWAIASRAGAGDLLAHTEGY